MEFRFTAEQDVLRGEVRAFAAGAINDFGRISSRPIDMEDWPGQLRFLKLLAARKWVAPGWPVAYGGLGWGHVAQMIFSEELSYAGAPDAARTFSVGMIGPTLIVHGTPEQKARHLSAITSGDVIWCQGYSEPGAGSDLAAMQTRAIRDGDDYVVTGEKIWTTGAHHADWMFMVARTSSDLPKHRGISFLLVDMKSPGIRVQPIVNIAGHHEFNQVFFDEVRVPVANRVGEENQGWYVAMTLLDFERSNVASIAANHRILDDLAAWIRANRPGGPYSAVLRHRLADLYLANEVGRLLSYRTAWMQEAGRPVNAEASVIKVFATELAQRISNFGVNAQGAPGTLLPGSPAALLGGRLADDYLEDVSPTIYSGSSEVQRNIIATRGLGLPRD